MPIHAHHLTDFMRHVAVQPNGCWVWRHDAPRQNKAPAFMNHAGRYKRAVVWAWNQIRPSKVRPYQRLRQMCSTKDCVNPDHWDAA